MGLDTSHNAWSGAYSSFNEWRMWLAQKVGFVLTGMKGFGGNGIWDEKMQSADYYTLLTHSDCDGELSPEQCLLTVQFLTSILEKRGNPKAEDWVTRQQYDRCERFMMGCQEAIKKQECLEFN